MTDGQANLSKTSNNRKGSLCGEGTLWKERLQMTTTANAHIQSCMEYLSRELDAVILRQILAKGIARPESLRRNDWSIVLRFLDEGKGRRRDPKVYKTTDVQCQLRMLTERLGSEGYPFDNADREVSTYAAELRIMRNRWAHNEAFDRDDAVRIYGTAARLFTALGEYTQASHLEMVRDNLRVKLFGLNAPVQPAPRISKEVREAIEKTEVRKSDVQAPAGAFTRPSVPIRHRVSEPMPHKSSTPVPVAAASEHKSAAVTSPAASERIRPSLTIEDKRYPFEGGQTIPMGEPSVFESMRNKANAASVRSTASEIAEFEGPIELNRLCRLVTYCFGLGRAYKDRVRQVSHQVRNNSEDLLVDEHGFVWPESIDRETWAEFRPHIEVAERSFEEISPVEIANAWRYFEANPELLEDGQDVQSAVLATFGRKRRTAAVKKHLELVKTLI